MFYFLIVLFIVPFILLILLLCNNYLPKWFCDHLGWHLTPKWQGWDGCSFTGVCPRCKKHVLQDGQGNWF